jgi:hypothetical protein
MPVRLLNSCYLSWADILHSYLLCFQRLCQSGTDWRNNRSPGDWRHWSCVYCEHRTSYGKLSVLPVPCSTPS